MNNSFTTSTSKELAINEDLYEIFSCYGGAIYGILLRSIGCKKLSEEILVKVFSQADELRRESGSDAPICFCELLNISRSMVADTNLPSTNKHLNEKTLDGLLSSSISLVEDRYSLGREIRKKLISFRK